MIADYLIRRAKRTPYWHLDGYMERYWLVPYRDVDAPQSVVGDVARKTENGCGPVSFWRRPIAWVLQQFGIAARVHHILRSDRERALHDHPWPYISIILRGGYWEVTDGHRWRWYGPGSVLFRQAEHLHRLVVSPGKSAWTLFITGRKRQSWGFVVDGQKIGWREYEQRFGAGVS